MADDREYNALLQKYNRLVARNRDLEAQVKEKESKWHELEQNYKINETLARDLCVLILAKNPSEMKLGEEYSWSKVPFRTLMDKTKVSFEAYNANRTKLLQEIQKQSEERRLTVESLQVQVEQLMRERKELDALHSGATAIDDDTGEILPAQQPGATQAPAPVLTSPAAKPVSDSTLKRVNYTMQQAARAGEIALVEDDGDISQSDLEQQATAARLSTAVSLERQNIKVAPSIKKQQFMKEVKAAEEQRLVQVDINEVVSQMTTRRWYIMEVIGSTGLCEGGELVDYIVSNYPDRKTDNFTKSGVMYELKTLVGTGMVIQDKTVTHPLSPNFAIYYFSSIGRRVYLDHFGKDPVLSEREILTAQHDNYEHGVGIKSLKQLLESSGNYTSVCMDRKENTITLSDGAKYIPDIKASGVGRTGRPFTAYFEYERGTHSQNDFGVKLTRMAKVTRILNIVCPNKQAVDACTKKTQKWIESRGGPTKVGTITVRITTLLRLKNSTNPNINDDDNWTVVFRLPNSAEPIIH